MSSQNDEHVEKNIVNFKEQHHQSGTIQRELLPLVIFLFEVF